MDTVLSLRNVTKRIKGKMIIQGIDFSVEKGQIYGFLGPNGAGKTMTLRMIVGLIKPTSGVIEICGHSISTSFVKAMSNVGCIIETPDLYEYMSGYDNLKLLSGMEPGIGELDIVDVVERVGLSRRIHDKVNTYSLGMKQRLGIAQALMKKPHLLILDEPANGLDPAGIREFRALMKSLAVNSGMTILISSHLLSEIQMICDEVAIILHGKIIKTSAVKDLLSDQKVTWQVNDVDGTVLLLKNLFGLAAIDLTHHTVSAFVDDQMMQEINAAMIASGIELVFVYKQQKSLEDLFMELTGGETIG
jgi:ABC-2 type transport system ATP-binding protein